MERLEISQPTIFWGSQSIKYSGTWKKRNPKCKVHILIFLSITELYFLFLFLSLLISYLFKLHGTTKGKKCARNLLAYN